MEVSADNRLGDSGTGSPIHKTAMRRRQSGGGVWQQDDLRQAGGDNNPAGMCMQPGQRGEASYLSRAADPGRAAPIFLSIRNPDDAVHNCNTLRTCTRNTPARQWLCPNHVPTSLPELRQRFVPSYNAASDAGLVAPTVQLTDHRHLVPSRTSGAQPITLRPRAWTGNLKMKRPAWLPAPCQLSVICCLQTDTLRGGSPRWREAVVLAWTPPLARASPRSHDCSLLLLTQVGTYSRVRL